MYASSEKKIDILNDHYKDTFSHLVSYRKHLDRVLLYLSALLGMMYLYQFFPNETTDAIFKVLSQKTDADIAMGPIGKMVLIFVPVWGFYFILYRRCRQVMDLIQVQYDYLEKLEIELASLYASRVPFTRESRFSLKGQNLSLWNYDFYSECLRLLNFSLIWISGTFGLRHYGFSWLWLSIFIMLVIFFLYLNYKATLKKKWDKIWSRDNKK